MAPNRALSTLSLLVVMGLLLGCFPARAQVPPYHISCDAPLGIDEAMLFLRGFRGKRNESWIDR